MVFGVLCPTQDETKSVALSEALDVLHRAMCITSHCCIAMVIEMASNVWALFVVVNFMYAHNHR